MLPQAPIADQIAECSHWLYISWNNFVADEGLQMGYIRKEISSADLRKQAPLLRIHRVQVGDVLLTRGTEKDSWKIALGTFGLFSHAGVFLCRLPHVDLARPLDPVLVESEDLGVGWTEFDPLSLVKGPGDSEWVTPLRGPPSAALLLRHPHVANLPPEILVEASKKLQDEQFFVDYPPRAMLSGALHAPNSVKSIFRWLQSNTMEGVDPATFGSFCSQLVAQFFKLLPIKLFEDDFEAHEVSPNRLSEDESALCLVPDAFFKADDINNSWIGEAYYSSARLNLDLSRDKWLPEFVNLNVMRKLAEQRIIDPFAKMMEREAPIRRQNLRDRFKKRFVDTIELLNKLYPPENPASAAKIEEVNESLAYTNVIDGLLQAEEAAPGSVLEKGDALDALQVTRDIISIQIERELMSERVRRLEDQMPEKRDAIAAQWAPLRAGIDTRLANLAKEIEVYLEVPKQAQLFAQLTTAIDERLKQLKGDQP
jgi:hypothetical protein